MDSVQTSEFYRTLIRPQCWRNGASQASASVKARPSGSCPGERGASSNLNHSLCMSMYVYVILVKFCQNTLWFLFEVCASSSLGTSRVQTKCTNPGPRLGQPMRGSCQMDKFQHITSSADYNMSRICLEHIRHEDWDMLKLVIRTCFDCERTCCPMNL
jgi:hypothetical protein